MQEYPLYITETKFNQFPLINGIQDKTFDFQSQISKDISNARIQFNFITTNWQPRDVMKMVIKIKGIVTQTFLRSGNA